MTSKSEIGKLGEDIACRYLVDKHYKVLDKNYRQKWGEIDIITKSPDKTLVFCEVKTMSQLSHPLDNTLSYSTGMVRQAQPLSNERLAPFLKPEDQMTQKKLQSIQRTASLYAGKYFDLVDDKKGWRIDLIAITLWDDGPELNHYENVF